MAFVLYLLAFGFYLLYKWSISTYDYFEKQGFPFKKPYPLLGTSGKVLFQKRPLSESIDEGYNSFSDHK